MLKHRFHPSSTLLFSKKMPTFNSDNGFRKAEIKPNTIILSLNLDLPIDSIGSSSSSSSSSCPFFCALSSSSSLVSSLLLVNSFNGVRRRRRNQRRRRFKYHSLMRWTKALEIIKTIRLEYDSVWFQFLRIVNWATYEVKCCLSSSILESYSYWVS